MGRHPEVQVSIDRIAVTRDGVTVDARNVILTATGQTVYDAAAAVHTQLVEILGLPEQGDPDEDGPVPEVDLTSPWPVARSVPETNP